MTLHSWVASSLVRHYPLTPAQSPRPLSLEGALNEQLSFQVVVRLEGAARQRVRVEVAGPTGWLLRVRRVGYVPLLHHNTPVPEHDADVEGRGHIPGYVPDPLYDEDTLMLPTGETHAFWITLRPGDGATPGDHAVHAVVVPEVGAQISHSVSVRLRDVVLRERQGFNITHWFYVDALIDWYRTDLFDACFWQILPTYVRDVVAHGQDTLYVPVFTPPLDGVKIPSQLLAVQSGGPEGYTFDWSDVRRYIALGKACGVRNWEWCHLFTQWGAQYAIRVYEGQGRDERLLWAPETQATSDTYRRFLARYLPQLRSFLEEEGILEHSLFHLSDEPHGAEHLERYRLARTMLRELAPWMRVMDALTEIEFARQRLTDMPIPSITTALDFSREGIPSWCYYCCGPRDGFLNRLLDTPLAKIAMHGLLFYRWPFHGFLHWGYNYWYRSQTRQLIDPYTVQDGLAWERGWAYGDTFLVYPGADGPVDSLRWEVFGESLQDYALLQTLNVPRDHLLLAPIRSLEDFPKSEGWRRGLRSQLLARRAG